MDRRNFLYTIGGSAAALASAKLEAHSLQNPTATVNKRWNNLKYAVYFLSEDIEKLLVDPADRRKTFEYFAPLRANRFYLEGSSNKEVDDAQMKKVAEAVRAEGVIAAGSMVPIVAGGPACYNNPGHMAILEKRARAMAQVFDEMILDDWLFTTCTCEKCVAERGQSTWADYRTRLLREKSKQHIIDPAKQVNPKIKVIIKFPDWAEGHRQNGYDVDGETRQFDAMAVGIETRIPTTQDQHIPIYSGYVFQKWWPSVDPSKWVGSWLDNYDMQGHANEFEAQVWQAVLAQSPEIILWCAGTLYPTDPASNVYPHFCEMLPEFDRVAGMLKGTARGVPMYLPYGSVGEYNVFGYLGMAGIPIAPVGGISGGQPQRDFQQAFVARHWTRRQTPGASAQWTRRLHDVGIVSSIAGHGIQKHAEPGGHGRQRFLVDFSFERLELGHRKGNQRPPVHLPTHRNHHVALRSRCCRRPRGLRFRRSAEGKIPECKPLCAEHAGEQLRLAPSPRGGA